jgi:hypothetical protein
VLVALLVRVTRLSGGLFTRGFFSKEQVLFMTVYVVTSGFVIASLLILSCLTLGYCIKLTLRLLQKRRFTLKSISGYKSMLVPLILLSGARIVFGQIYFDLLAPTSVALFSARGWY